MLVVVGVGDIDLVMIVLLYVIGIATDVVCVVVVHAVVTAVVPPWLLADFQLMLMLGLCLLLSLVKVLIRC